MVLGSRALSLIFSSTVWSFMSDAHKKASCLQSCVNITSNSNLEETTLKKDVVLFINW